MEERIRTIFRSSIEDLLMDILYYNRKHDRHLPPGIIEDYIRSGVVSVDEIVAEFRKQLEKNVRI